MLPVIRIANITIHTVIRTNKKLASILINTSRSRNNNIIKIKWIIRPLQKKHRNSKILPVIRIAKFTEIDIHTPIKSNKKLASSLINTITRTVQIQKTIF